MDPVGNTHCRGSWLFHLLTRASEGSFLSLFLSWAIWLPNRKPSMTVGQPKGQIPSPGFFQVVLGSPSWTWEPPVSLGTIVSVVMAVQPVPWGCMLEPSGDLDQKERSSLESGHRKGGSGLVLGSPTPGELQHPVGTVSVIKALPYCRGDEAEARGHGAPPCWATGPFSQGPTGLQHHLEGDRRGSHRSQEVTTFNPLVLLPVEARAGL